MKDDDAIKSVRNVRQLISLSQDHNPKKLVEYYKKLQSRHKDRLISERSASSLQKDKDAA